MIAKTIMDKRFFCLHPDQTIAEAIGLFKSAGEEQGRRIFGMMVTDDQDHLVGMLSMYDILLFIQPKHLHIFGDLDDVSAQPMFEGLLNRVRNIRVEDIMTTDLVTIKPDTHLLAVIDIMVRKHVRRLPVIGNDRVVGIVYRSDVFFELMGKLDYL